MGGARGLAGRGGRAGHRRTSAAARYAGPFDALKGGYHAAFAFGAALAAVAAVIGFALRIRQQGAVEGVGPAMH
ncbi:hypothetical protein DWU95_47035 [Burkholderia contaminans]|nr:hypothetical protein DWU95_47035 [Burkholderia contaminans]